MVSWNRGISIRQKLPAVMEVFFVRFSFMVQNSLREIMERSIKVLFFSLLFFFPDVREHRA